MRMMILLCGLWMTQASAQESTRESDLSAAIQATIDKGFAFSIRPSATIPDGFPQEGLMLAGTSITGEYSEGVGHSKDGSYEIYRKGDRTAVRTERGWLSLDRYTSPLRQDVAQAFDDRDGKLWRRGNVTAGKKALLQLIQIAHLNRRTTIDRLTAVGKAFNDPKVVETAKLDGKAALLYEGELSDTAAFDLLQGPFTSLVERGTLAFRNASGVGRVWVQNGVVRRVVFKAAGAYSYYEETDNIKRRGTCSLEVVADLTKHGEVKVEMPREAAKILATESASR